jgi:hypothetical protein
LSFAQQQNLNPNFFPPRPKIGKFLPENIDPFLCTHLVFAFGWIKNGKLTSFEANDVAASSDGKPGLYQVPTLWISAINFPASNFGQIYTPKAQRCIPLDNNIEF